MVMMMVMKMKVMTMMTVVVMVSNTILLSICYVLVIHYAKVYIILNLSKCFEGGPILTHILQMGKLR